jgi:hypothetical protein
MIYLLIAVAQQFLFALFFFPTLRWPGGRRTFVLIALGVPIALSPLWIPLEKPPLRMLAAMNATAILAKLYDLHVTANRSIRPGFPAFAAFLPNWFSIVWRRLAAEPSPTTRQNLIALFHALWKTAVAIALLKWLSHQDWREVPFLLEHCAKALALFLVIIPSSAIGTSLWRLGGGKARDFMDAPLLAATPARFWRRYNRPAQQFFYENIFKPAGGLKAPLRATIVTFIVSALVHEYVFGIALERIQGYQTVFFLLQGLAVAATIRSRPVTWLYWPALAATWIFNLLASVFFLASISYIFPFYSRGLPSWLEGWHLLPAS